MHRLILTLNPQNSCWELFAGSTPGVRALLGWVTGAPSIDAGMPPGVASLFAGTLCRCVTPTFFGQPEKGKSLTDRWQTTGEGQAKQLKAGILDRVRGNPTFTLFATRNPAEAESLFFNDQFSWELRAQRVFLSPIDVLPDLDYQHVNTIFNLPAKLDLIAHFEGTNVNGLMLPGVDGDFAELVVFNEDQWPALEQSLSQECAARGIDFQIVDEPTFKQTKWVEDSP